MNDDCKFLVLSKHQRFGIDFCFVLQRLVMCKGKMSLCEHRVVWGVSVNIAEPRFSSEEDGCIND